MKNLGYTPPGEIVPIRKHAPKIKEGHIREALDKRVASYGGETRAVSWIGRKNAPDVLCLFSEVSFPAPAGRVIEREAHHVFCETKRPKKNATAAQAREHERMRAAGCVVMVITTIEELDAWLPPL